MTWSSFSCDVVSSASAAPACGKRARPPVERVVVLPLVLAAPALILGGHVDTRTSGAALVLAVQHQRLAEHQQRLWAAEAKAQKLEFQGAALRTALGARFRFYAS